MNLKAIVIIIANSWTGSPTFLNGFNNFSIPSVSSIGDVVNVNNKKTGIGEVAGVVKAVESSGKTIAVVLADRVDFFDISGRYLNTLNISGKYKSLKLYNSGGYACIDLTDVLKFVKIR